ncbi:MAG TPA: hypothetical protein VEG34_16420 [Thermoanaerobaculia bacterium]|nr:hypothetical protein [Thermoanaerobaculia bacterium]
MRFHGWTVVLCCLATLPGAPAAAQTSAQMSPGQISLGVSQPGGAALAIDLAALARDLCDGTARPTIRSSAECGLTVNNYPPYQGGTTARPGIVLKSAGSQSFPGGRLSVPVRPEALELAGTTPANTPCGSWQYSLHLDPAAVQAAAPLTLHPAARRPPQGVFAGVVEVAAVLHLVPLDADGEPIESAAVDLPFDFTLQLAGAWGAAPGSPPDPAGSNLLLFAGFAGNLWLSRPGCGWTIFDGVWCESCVEPGPDVLQRFNDRFQPGG